MFKHLGVGQYVCHYTKAETFLTHILPTMRLRMSSFAMVNDPRESRGWLCSLAVPDELMDREWDIVSLSERFSDFMKKTAKLLCVTRDDPMYDPNGSAHLYGRGYAHPSMWDRYAGGHSGVCLMLDVEKLSTAIALAAEGRGDVYRQGVSYADMPPGETSAYHLYASDIVQNGEEQAFRAHQARHHGALYFWKSRDWAAEFEYRWVVLDSQRSDLFVSVEDCLSAVIFGDAFALHAIPMVNRILADTGIKLAQLKYRNGHPIILQADLI